VTKLPFRTADEHAVAIAAAFMRPMACAHADKAGWVTRAWALRVEALEGASESKPEGLRARIRKRTAELMEASDSDDVDIDIVRVDDAHLLLVASNSERAERERHAELVLFSVAVDELRGVLTVLDVQGLPLRYWAALLQRPVGSD
jgi:hypothetical protein